jgi:hypothetical protein
MCRIYSLTLMSNAGRLALAKLCPMRAMGAKGNPETWLALSMHVLARDHCFACARPARRITSKARGACEPERRW